MIKTKNIILIHGWDSNTKKLEPLANELKKLGWNPHIPKLPFFDLPKPNNPWSLASFASFIERECQKKFPNQPYFLFGHSNGGRITIKLAYKKPKNLQGIVLCATAGIFRDPLIKRIPFKILSTIFKPLKKTSLYTKYRKIPHLITHNYDYYKIDSHVKKATFNLIIKEGLKPLAKKITLPCLILWGTKDKLTPIKAAYWLKRNLKNSSLETYSNQSHSLPYSLSHQLAQDIDQWRLKI